jgi:hypothetical protein
MVRYLAERVATLTTQRHPVTLDDKYHERDGSVLISGIQAFVHLPIIRRGGAGQSCNRRLLFWMSFGRIKGFDQLL